MRREREHRAVWGEPGGGFAPFLRAATLSPLSHRGVLVVAGVIGFVGNEVAAQVRLREGKRLSSAALIADGNHARIDCFVSLGVVASAIMVSLGALIADPIIDLVSNTGTHVYTCKSCGATLRPREGECCVFCLHSDVRCPPRQRGRQPGYGTPGTAWAKHSGQMVCECEARGSTRHAKVIRSAWYQASSMHTASHHAQMRVRFRASRTKASRSSASRCESTSSGSS
jgi:Cation efflux family